MPQPSRHRRIQILPQLHTRHFVTVVSVAFCSFLIAGPVLAEERAARVAVEAVETGPYQVTLPEKVGLLRAGKHRALAFEVSGRLVALAEEGADVSEGEKIAELDTTLETARLRQARLRLREAENEQSRQLGLRKSNAVSAKGLENAETSLGIAKAELDASREQLRRRRMLAPFDGVVAETFIELGEVVNPGSPALTFMKLDPLRIELGIPAYQVARITLSSSVLVSLPAHPDEVFEGSVVHVAAAAAEGRHLFKVEVEIPNPENLLRPGMSARARIVTHTLDRAVAVPASVAVERNGKRVVFFADGNRAVSVDVEHALLHGDQLVLIEESPYSKLVVRGHRDLQDGILLKIDNRILGRAEAAP